MPTRQKGRICYFTWNHVNCVWSAGASLLLYHTWGLIYLHWRRPQLTMGELMKDASCFTSKKNTAINTMYKMWPQQNFLTYPMISTTSFRIFKHSLMIFIWVAITGRWGLRGSRKGLILFMNFLFISNTVEILLCFHAIYCSNSITLAITAVFHWALDI